MPHSLIDLFRQTNHPVLFSDADTDKLKLGQSLGGSGSSFDPSTHTLNEFAATSSAQLASVISDETGSGLLVFATSPTLVTPTIGAANATSLTINSAVLIGNASANIIEQRNSMTAQGYRVYNTWTDASNGEWGAFDWTTTANALTIGTNKNGTGATRNLQFFVGGALKLDYGISNSGEWTIPSTISTRVGPLGVSGSVTASSSFVAGAGGYFVWGTTRSAMTSPADGLIRVTNQAETGFGRLQFGGTTASFPSLKQSGAVLQTRLADDSGFAQIQGVLTTDANATTGLTAGVLAALTNATITITDASGQVYRVPCII